MKRTKKINLAFMRKAATTTLLSGSFLISGCDSGQMASFYRNIEECQKDNPIYTFSCEDAYSRAVIEARKTSPKYSSLTDCEYDFGKGHCMGADNNQFMPQITGFLLAETSDNYYDYDDPEPLYRYRGSYVNGSGLNYGSSLGKKMSVSSSTFTTKSGTSSTLSRGGFGSMVSAKSSSSGSHSSGRSFGG